MISGENVFISYCKFLVFLLLGLRKARLGMFVVSGYRSPLELKSRVTYNYPQEIDHRLSSASL